MNEKLKVGFIAFHPGSANTLTKVIESLREENHEVYCYPFIDYARKEWKVNEIYGDTDDFFEKIPTDLDVLMYSPVGMALENEVPAFCKKHGIKSIGTVDVFWLDKDIILKRFPVLPDIIITPEKSVETMIHELQLDVEVHNLGNPHLDIKKGTNRYIDNADKVFTYVSFPATDELISDTGEKSKEIMQELVKLVRKDKGIKKLYLALHPRESESFVKELLDSNIDVKNRIKLNPYPSTTDCCFHSDVIIGYKSTVLYEEYLKGKAVLFFDNPEQMEEDIEDANELYCKELFFELPKNPAKNILRLLEECKTTKALSAAGIA